MMTLFEKIERLTVQARRAWWQCRASYVTTADLNYLAPYTTPCSFGPVLSGGEFTPGGSYPQNYSYPIPATIDYYASKGVTIIRLPFLWERVQPTLYSDLDAVEMGRIDPIVDYAISKGMTVGIDVHNGGYRFDDLIGDSSVPDAAFADLWSRLAQHYMNKSQTLFMLMSEPHDQSAKKWVRTANAAIAAIRKTGAIQTIVVPGSYYDGGWTWCKSDNAEKIGHGIYDPLDNWMIEIHQYMDSDASGGTSGIVSPTIGADRLADVTLWARAHNKKLFLGEFASGPDPVSLQALDNMLRYITNNSDVWRYATWWGAGDKWANYFFKLDPTDYANPIDTPQMIELLKYIK
jgi:endoglucanase